MSDHKHKPLIPARVLLLGENAVPREILDPLTDEHLQIFLREPDPSRWPAEMQSLIEFLPREERLKARVWSLCAEHENPLNEFLKEWTPLIWNKLTREEGFSPENAHLVIDEIARYMKTGLTKCLGDKHPTRAGLVE